MRRFWSVSLVCLAVCIAVCIAADGVDAWAQRYMFQGYDQHQGLTNLDVRCILQDRAGLIWVGTDAGLDRKSVV